MIKLLIKPRTRGTDSLFSQEGKECDFGTWAGKSNLEDVVLDRTTRVILIALVLALPLFSGTVTTCVFGEFTTSSMNPFATGTGTQFQQSWPINDLLASCGPGAITQFAFGSTAGGTLSIINLMVDFSLSPTDLVANPASNIGSRDTLVYGGSYSVVFAGNEGDMPFTLTAPFAYSSADSGMYLIGNFMLTSPIWQLPPPPVTNYPRAGQEPGSSLFDNTVRQTVLQTTFQVQSSGGTDVPEPPTALLAAGFGFVAFFVGKHRRAR